jgi:hypothetical protein
MRLLVVMLALLWLAPPAWGAEVSIADLDADPERWNGLEVTIRGEIIGDSSRRDSEVWVQVNDDFYVNAPSGESGSLAGGNTGLGVRMPLDHHDQSWGEPGGYHVRGPIVRVTGTFRYADPVTGGDTFVDASSVLLIEPARPIDSPPAQMGLFAAALGMIAGGAALWGRSRWLRLNPKQ